MTPGPKLMKKASAVELRDVEQTDDVWTKTMRALGWGALLVSALALGGCATSIADLPVVGTPADAPARPKDRRRLSAGA